LTGILERISGALQACHAARAGSIPIGIEPRLILCRGITKNALSGAIVRRQCIATLPIEATELIVAFLRSLVGKGRSSIGGVVREQIE
jgi:hypothetical protein